MPKDVASGGAELNDVGRLTGLYCSGLEGTLSAPADVSPCPGNCCWGNI